MSDTTTVDIVVTGTISPDCYPNKPQDYLNTIAPMMSATMPGGATFVFGPPGSTTPPTDITQPWLKINSDGSIDGWYTYVLNVTKLGGAAWVRPYPIGTDLHQHWLWSGADGATGLWVFDGGDGTDPTVTGNVGPAWGAFWQVDHVFDGRMAYGPDAGNPGATPPVPPIDVGDSGGTDGYTLDGTHLPPHSHQIPILFHDAWAYHTTNGLFWFPTYNRTPIGNVTNPGVKVPPGNPYNWPWCQGTQDIRTDDYMLRTSNWGSGTLGAKINTLSPYKAIYFIQRTARKYIIA
jgi:hypothetical protein